eukprot:1930347-Pyramimonas_sp.AAC.1
MVALAGDFNVADRPPRSLGTTPDLHGQPLAERQHRRDQFWGRLFSWFTEVEVEGETHFNKQMNPLSAIDRVFVSSPGWSLTQLNASAELH